MTDEHDLDGREGTLDRLKKLARERWGDEWAIKQKHWADGTTTEHAYHVIGPTDVKGVDQDIREYEYLWLNEDGEYVVEHVQLTVEKAVSREVVADPFDIVDEAQIEWSWVKDKDNRWHCVTGVDETEDGDKRTLVCGDVLEADEVEEMATHDPSDQDYQIVDLCNECAASRT